MTSLTAAGSTLAISIASPATKDAAGYAALTFTEIGQVEKIGAFGASFAKVEFQPLKGTKQKYKGSKDNGAIQPSMMRARSSIPSASPTRTVRSAISRAAPSACPRTRTGPTRC
jgi:hypothetical protein